MSDENVSKAIDEAYAVKPNRGKANPNLSHHAQLLRDQAEIRMKAIEYALQIRVTSSATQLVGDASVIEKYILNGEVENRPARQSNSSVEQRYLDGFNRDRITGDNKPVPVITVPDYGEAAGKTDVLPPVYGAGEVIVPTVPYGTGEPGVDPTDNNGM